MTGKLIIICLHYKKYTEDNMKKIYLVLIVLLIFICLSAQDKSQERIAKEMFNEGVNKFEAKQYDAAVESFKNSLEAFNKAKNDHEKFDTEIKSTLLKLYEVGVTAKNYNIATQYGSEYLKLDPTNEQMVKSLAQTYRVGLNNIPKAVEVWQTFDSRISSFTAKQEIASLYERVNDFTNAVLWYNKALEMRKDADVLQKVASIYINSKEPNKAISIYEDFINTNPSQKELAKTYRNMGTLYKDIKNLSKAIENYEKSLEIEYNKDITTWLLSEYYDIQNFSSAEKHIQTLLSKDAKNPIAIYFKGCILYGDGKFNEAKIEFQKITGDKTYGNSAEAYIKSINSQN